MKKWWVTPWSINPEGGWAQQPVILIEGETPFFANHPQPYIDRLRQMHLNPELERGQYHTLIGQFEDVLELAWKETVNAEKSSY